MKLQHLICVFVTIATIALAGCGGGGGGGGSTSPMDQMGGGNGGTGTGGGGNGTMPSVSVFGDLNVDQMVADDIVTAIGRAAEATPLAGSVTQSSNVDSDGVTTDQMDVTAEYGANAPSFSISNGTEWSIGMGEGNPSPISDATPPWKGAELSKNVDGGTVYVEAYSDIEAPVTRQVDSGDDGTRDVSIGTMILGAGITINAGGGITGQTGMLDGEPGTFNCSGGCGVTNGVATRGMWTFTPDRPPGAIDVPNNVEVMFTGTYDRDRTPGTYNGQMGYFSCLSARCGRATINGRLTLPEGDWIFVPTSGTTTVSVWTPTIYPAGFGCSFPTMQIEPPTTCSAHLWTAAIPSIRLTW